MKEYISDLACYCFDDNGRQGFGEFLFHDNSKTIDIVVNYKDGRASGETKSFNRAGNLRTHTYRVVGKVVHDFVLNPLSDEEKMLLVLRYGGPMLPKKFYSKLLKKEIDL